MAVLTYAEKKLGLKRLEKKCKGMGYGDEITWSTIRTLAGDIELVSVRRWLLHYFRDSRGMEIVAMRGRGYRVLLPEEYQEYGLLYARRAHRAIARWNQTVERAPTSSLTRRQREDLSNDAVWSSKIRDLLTTTLQSIYDRYAPT